MLAPTLLLLAAHYLVTVTLNVSPLYLRIASVIIPLPFGIELYVLHRIGFRWAMAPGIVTAVLSVAGMLAVIGYLDGVSVVRQSRRDWREVLEYITSIALAFGTGNLLAVLTFQLLPKHNRLCRATQRRGFSCRADARSQCRRGHTAPSRASDSGPGEDHWANGRSAHHGLRFDLCGPQEHAGWVIYCLAGSGCCTGSGRSRTWHSRHAGGKLTRRDRRFVRIRRVLQGWDFPPISEFLIVACHHGPMAHIG